MGSRLRRTLLTLSGIIFLLFVPITASHGQSLNYYYDDLNRLIRVENPDGTIIGYTYDEVGNRVGEATPPPVGTPVSASGSITTPTPTYTWDAVLGVTMYCLKVDDSTGTKVQQCFTPAQAGCPDNTGTCSVTPSTALAAGAGRWWIETYNLGGNGSWSAPMEFSVDPPPAATLVSPTGTTITKQPTYTWNAVPSATRYDLFVNASGGVMIQQWYTAEEAGCPGGTGTCSVTPSTQLSEGFSKWWVQTNNDVGNGPLSAEMDFTIFPSHSDPYTKSLLHFDGADGGGTFVDEMGKIWIPAGNAVTKANLKKFGSASGYFPGSPSYVFTPAHVDFQFGTGDYTIDFWINTTATSGFIITNLDGGNIYNSPTIMFGQNGAKIDWYPAYDGSHKITSTANINDGQWHHIGAVRNGTTFTLYVDGAHQGGEITGWNPTINGTNQILRIGRDGSGGWHWTGYIDELRISKGIARWTMNFTPPSAEYSTPPPTTTASPAGGIYGTSQSVTLTCTDPQGQGCARIYYTTDGTTPTTSSPIYSAPINISATTTLRFFGADLVGNREPVKAQIYTIDTTPPTTTASPAGGIYNSSRSVTLSCTDVDSGCDKIYYTTDGTTPTTSSPVYSFLINISSTTTLKFFASDKIGNSESVKTQIYTIDTTPPTTTASPAGGTYSSSQSVTLSCTDVGSGCDKIYYTTDGTTPTTSSPIYSSPISITATTTLKFFAKDLAGLGESVKAQIYTIDTTPPTTTASPAGGTYSSSQSVTLSCTDVGSGCDKIYYTTDGTTPTTSSPIYSSPINISTTTTLKFFARDLAGNSGAVKSETYTILNGTIMVTVQLKDSAGNPLSGGAVEYYSGGWKAFGTTDGSGQVSKELLPASYSFRMTYAFGLQQKSQNVASNPTVVFQTTKVTVQLQDSTGALMDTGTVQYYSEGWHDIGSTSGGQVSTELLPASYSFRMTYAFGLHQKSQNIAGNPTVVFNTGQVHSDTGSCTRYYASGWRTFIQNMELLPVTYNFRFNDGTGDRAYTINAGTVNHIH